MLREQNLAQRVRGREMDGAHVEGAWLFLKCKEKSPEALEQACDLICIFKRRLCRVENALQYVCVLGGGRGACFLQWFRQQRWKQRWNCGQGRQALLKGRADFGAGGRAIFRQWLPGPQQMAGRIHSDTCSDSVLIFTVLRESQPYSPVLEEMGSARYRTTPGVTSRTVSS